MTFCNCHISELNNVIVYLLLQVYGRIYRVVEPKRQRLNAATQQLKEKQFQLQEAKDKLAEVSIYYYHTLQFTWISITEWINLMDRISNTGFPPIRENFEKIFQSGKTGCFSQNQGNNFQIREILQQYVDR